MRPPNVLSFLQLGIALFGITASGVTIAERTDNITPYEDVAANKPGPRTPVKWAGHGTIQLVEKIGTAAHELTRPGLTALSTNIVRNIANIQKCWENERGISWGSGVFLGDNTAAPYTGWGFTTDALHKTAYMDNNEAAFREAIITVVRQVYLTAGSTFKEIELVVKAQGFRLGILTIYLSEPGDSMDDKVLPRSNKPDP